jgi:hypothetical protein
MHRKRLHWQTVMLTVATALLLGGGASAGVGSGSGPPTSVGTGGGAASVERLATQAAIDTLKADGNAVDAAVAAAAVLGVTEPFSSGIGGGGFMVLRTAEGEVTTVDGGSAGAAVRHTVWVAERSCPSSEIAALRRSLATPTKEVVPALPARPSNTASGLQNDPALLPRSRLAEATAS